MSSVFPDHNHHSHSLYSGSRDVLEAYWDRLGEKPTQKTKRGGSPAGGNTNKELPFKFAPDGSDEWLPPVPSAGNWETLVHVVENIEKDEKGAVWANLLWNKMKKDGDPIRNKAPVWTCYMACPQKVRARSICHRFLNVDIVADAGLLREAYVSFMPIHFFLSLTVSSFPSVFTQSKV